MNLNGSKAKNVRQVTVLEDVKNKKTGKVTLKKGSVHAMHNEVAQKLKERGAKIDIKPLNIERLTQQRIAEMEEA